MYLCILTRTLIAYFIIRGFMLGGFCPRAGGGGGFCSQVFVMGVVVVVVVVVLFPIIHLPMNSVSINVIYRTCSLDCLKGVLVSGQLQGKYRNNFLLIYLHPSTNMYSSKCYSFHLQACWLIVCNFIIVMKNSVDVQQQPAQKCSWQSTM